MRGRGCRRGCGNETSKLSDDASHVRASSESIKDIFVNVSPFILVDGITNGVAVVVEVLKDAYHLNGASRHRRDLYCSSLIREGVGQSRQVLLWDSEEVQDCLLG